MNLNINKFLLDDTPIVVQPRLAELFKSLDEAAVLQQIHYWVSRSDKVHDGKKWTYNTMEDWLKQFPWIGSTRTLKRYFDDLVDKKILKVGNFNKVKFDRTKWYTIDYDAFYDFVNRCGQNVQMEPDKSTESKQTNCPNPTGQNDRTYTLDYPETNTEINTDDHEHAQNKTDENPFQLAQELNISVNGSNRTAMFIKYIDRLGAGLVCYALRQTAENADYPGWSYLTAVMDRLENDEIKTVEEAQAKSAKHRRGQKRGGRIKEPIPDWLFDDDKPDNKVKVPESSKNREPALKSDGTAVPKMPKIGDDGSWINS